MKQCFLLLLAIAFSFTSSPAEDAVPTDAAAPKLYSVTVKYITPNGKAASFSSSNLISPDCTLPIDAHGSPLWNVNVQEGSEQPSTEHPKPKASYITVSIFDISHIAQNANASQIFVGSFPFKSDKEITVLKTPNYSVTLSITESVDEKK